VRREVREEVGLAVEVRRLVGVYSKPQKREVVLTFLCQLAGGEPAEPGESEEVSEVGWFAADALPEPFLPKHRQRLEDALRGGPEALLRTQATSTEADQRLDKPL
jgi:ADP-ribose pyrophosphatase YjhB (NUDIX family)